MHRKFIAFVLTLVLAWAGISAQGQSVSAAAPAASAALGGDAKQPDGQQTNESLTQVHAETSADLTGLLPAHSAPRDPALCMSRPSGYAMVRRHPPYLDGLRRPPRQPNFIA